MQSDSTTTISAANHAKILTLRGRQILAFVQRIDDDEVAVVLQMWHDGSNSQVRAAIRSAEQEQLMAIFCGLDLLHEKDLLELLGDVGLVAAMANLGETL